MNIRPSDDEFIYSQFTLSLCNWMPAMEYRLASRRLVETKNRAGISPDRAQFQSYIHAGLDCALAFWWSMIFSENRYPLFGVML
jgi:hypothetical protein